MPSDKQLREVVSLNGDKALLAVFQELPKVMRNRVLRNALKAGARPIKTRVDILTPLQSPPYAGQSPTVRLAKLQTKIVARPRSRKWVGWRVQFPVRTKMKIAANDPHYYPAALEYGHGNVFPVAMMRRGLAQARGQSEAVIRKDVKANLDTEVAALAAKKASKK